MRRRVGTPGKIQHVVFMSRVYVYLPVGARLFKARLVKARLVPGSSSDCMYRVIWGSGYSGPELALGAPIHVKCESSRHPTDHTQLGSQ